MGENEAWLSGGARTCRVSRADPPRGPFATGRTATPTHQGQYPPESYKKRVIRVLQGRHRDTWTGQALSVRTRATLAHDRLGFTDGSPRFFGGGRGGSQRRPYCGFRGVGVRLLCLRELGSGKARGYGVGSHEAIAPSIRVSSRRRAIPTRGRSTGVWALSFFMPPPWKARASTSALGPPGRAVGYGEDQTRRRRVRPCQRKHVPLRIFCASILRMSFQMKTGQSV